MIITIDSTLSVPPFEQLRDQIRAMVIGGTLNAGFRLPPVRQLASDLGLANGTVARAYRELEELRLVVTQGRNGTVVAALEQAASTERQRLIDSAAESYVTATRALGLSVDEMLTAVRRAAMTR